GGSDGDDGNWIVVDAAGNTYVVGSTASADFPATIGTFHGGTDIFLAKFGPNGSLAWAAQYGGSSGDFGEGVTLDDSGHLNVAGGTDSDDFPTTPGAFQETHNGIYDNVFVLKLDAATGAVVLCHLLRWPERG